MFLDWNSQETIHKEADASRHFARYEGETELNLTVFASQCW
jgi:hypothetical protein